MSLIQLEIIDHQPLTDALFSRLFLDFSLWLVAIFLFCLGVWCGTERFIRPFPDLFLLINYLYFHFCLSLKYSKFLSPFLSWEATVMVNIFLIKTEIYISPWKEIYNYTSGFFSLLFKLIGVRVVSADFDGDKTVGKPMSDWDCGLNSILIRLYLTSLSFPTI